MAINPELLKVENRARLLQMIMSGEVDGQAVVQAYANDSDEFQGKKYKDRDMGLFNAILDENAAAVRWLVKKGGHDVNCYIGGSGWSDREYMRSPTPLSYALSHAPSMVETLLKLGAKWDERALEIKADMEQEKSKESVKKPEIKTTDKKEEQKDREEKIRNCLGRFEAELKALQQDANANMSVRPGAFTPLQQVVNGQAQGAAAAVVVVQAGAAHPNKPA